MKRDDVKRLANEEGIDPRTYSLDGSYNEDQLVLEESGTHWVVYYYERGERWDEQLFGSEDEACTYLIDRLRRDPTTRRR